MSFQTLLKILFRISRKCWISILNLVFPYLYSAHIKASSVFLKVTHRWLLCSEDQLFLLVQGAAQEEVIWGKKFTAAINLQEIRLMQKYFYTHKHSATTLLLVISVLRISGGEVQLMRLHSKASTKSVSTLSVWLIIVRHPQKKILKAVRSKDYLCQIS